MELRRSLACTNIAEDMMGTIRHVTNVKRWRSGTMALRWVAAGMIEAAKGFRKLKAHRQLPFLRAALIAQQERLTKSTVARHRGPHNVQSGKAARVKFNNERDIPFDRPKHPGHLITQRHLGTLRCRREGDPPHQISMASRSWSRGVAGIGYHANASYWDGITNMITLWERMGVVEKRPGPTDPGAPAAIPSEVFVEVGRGNMEMRFDWKPSDGQLPK
jgi:hypothetical protein